MSWVERQMDTGVATNVAADKAHMLDQAKAEGLPVVEKEAARGQMPIDPVRFTPVKSPGIYEAEFAKRDSDVIFHFWPYGFHQAHREGKRPPGFVRNMLVSSRQVMVEQFGESACEFHSDADMGALSVKVKGLGEKQFFHELSVKALEKLHYALGGS